MPVTAARTTVSPGHARPVQPRRGWADRARLPARRPHPGARPTYPARLTDQHLVMWPVAKAREQPTGYIADLGTASGYPGGHRPLAQLPYRVVTDVMVGDPARHRTCTPHRNSP